MSDALPEAFDHAVVADRVLPARIARMRLFLNQRRLVPDKPITPGS